MAKTKLPGEVIKTIPAKKGKWEVYKYVANKVTGFKAYGNRLIAKNGNIICNNKDFNQLAGALKNIRSVKASA